GRAIEARIATTTIAIISSRSVNPLSLRMRPPLFLGGDARKRLRDAANRGDQRRQSRPRTVRGGEYCANYFTTRECKGSLSYNCALREGCGEIAGVAQLVEQLIRNQ